MLKFNKEKKYTIISLDFGGWTYENLNFDIMTDEILQFKYDDGQKLKFDVETIASVMVIREKPQQNLLLKNFGLVYNGPKNGKLVYLIVTVQQERLLFFEEERIIQHDFSELLLDEDYYVLYYGGTGINMNERGRLTYKGDGIKFATAGGSVWFPNKEIKNKISYKNTAMWSDFILTKLGVTDTLYNEPVYEFEVANDSYVVVLKESNERLIAEGGTK